VDNNNNNNNNNDNDMDLGDIEWCGMGQIGLVQDKDKWRALVSAVINLQVP
jgi:hypothetical protein